MHLKRKPSDNCPNLDISLLAGLSKVNRNRFLRLRCSAKTPSDDEARWDFQPQLGGSILIRDEWERSNSFHIPYFSFHPTAKTLLHSAGYNAPRCELFEGSGVITVNIAAMADFGILESTSNARSVEAYRVCFQLKFAIQTQIFVVPSGGERIEGTTADFRYSSLRISQRGVRNFGNPPPASISITFSLMTLSCNAFWGIQAPRLLPSLCCAALSMSMTASNITCNILKFLVIQSGM